MEELIKIQVKNDRQLVSARDLHKGLEVKRRFSAWWNQNSKGFKENEDFQPVLVSTPRENRGSIKVQDYLITIDAAKKICMMSKTKKGDQVRDYFINIEKRFKKIQSMKTPKKDSYMIADPIERAKRWIEEEQRRLELSDKNKKLQKQINDESEDVVFAKAISYSHHAITVRELAEILTQNGFQIGQNQLFKLLRDTKYLSKQKDFWNLPMSSKVKAGYFRVTHNITRDGRPYRKTLVTPKGQKHIINKALRGNFDDDYQKVLASTLNV